MLARAVWQVALGHPWGSSTVSNASVVGWTIFLWLIYFRLITIKLVTEVFPDELRVSMRGLWRSARIRVDRIRSLRTVTFDPRDWGGYGMRSTTRGRAYIARGKQGVELQMSGGAIVLIGSQRPAELERAIRRASGQ